MKAYFPEPVRFLISHVNSVARPLRYSCSNADDSAPMERIICWRNASTVIQYIIPKTIRNDVLKSRV